jgi:hypothetical protein
MKYETRFQPPLPRNQFLKRVALHFAVGAALIAGSLAIGMVGYHTLEGLDWIDSFLNATMLLGGMGPVNTPASSAGKLFAGFYALYSGLIFLVAVAIVLAPAFHRIMHKLHWDEKGEA